MSIAEIHRKSSNTGSEDSLTADVFTAFRYLPADSGIVGFLRSIPGVGNVIPPVGEKASCEFYFWPMGRHFRREPDVLLELVLDGRIFHVVIEAKYQSGPSDLALESVEHLDEIIQIGNQLADQMRDLRQGEYTIFVANRRRKRKKLSSQSEDRLLLYLTAQPLRPVAEIRQSKELVPAAADRFFWANWYDVYDYLETQRESLSSFPYNRILDDILTLLKIKQFAGFQGIEHPPALQLESGSGSFWRDRRKRLPAFHGISQPPQLALEPQSGSFWTKPQEG